LKDRHSIRNEIKEIVDRETRAWDTKNVELLLTIFHPDMVWPWPRDSKAHDPINWKIGFGRFNEERWTKNWQSIFIENKLVHNTRKIMKIEVSNEGDGAFAVVDIDTLWRDKEGNESHWKGRVCKVYSKVGDKWLMTMHTGVLEY
jgi:hypothetical protein